MDQRPDQAATGAGAGLSEKATVRAQRKTSGWCVGRRSSGAQAAGNCAMLPRHRFPGPRFTGLAVAGCATSAKTAAAGAVAQRPFSCMAGRCSFVRFEVHPQGREAAEAWSDLPSCVVVKRREDRPPPGPKVNSHLLEPPGTGRCGLAPEAHRDRKQWST